MGVFWGRVCRALMGLLVHRGCVGVLLGLVVVGVEAGCLGSQFDLGICFFKQSGNGKVPGLGGFMSQGMGSIYGRDTTVRELGGVPVCNQEFFDQEL